MTECPIDKLAGSSLYCYMDTQHNGSLAVALPAKSVPFIVFFDGLKGG